MVSVGHIVHQVCWEKEFVSICEVCKERLGFKKSKKCLMFSLMMPSIDYFSLKGISEVGLVGGVIICDAACGVGAVIVEG